MLHPGSERKPLLIVASLSTIGAILALALTPAVSDQVRPLMQALNAISCNGLGPCVQYNNSGTGEGIAGQSAKGSGAIGITTSNSTSASNGVNGILGSDQSTSGKFDSGVRGVSVRGSGVVGSSKSGNGMSASSVSGAGLIATSTSGSALTATSTSGAGLLATSTNSDAIYATSTNFYGIGGLTLNASTKTGVGYAGVLAQDNSSDGGHLNSGVLGYSVNGLGVAAFSGKWVGADVIGGAVTSDGVFSTTMPALSIVATNGGDFIDACASGTQNPCTGESASFLVDGSGDVASAGTLAGGNGNIGGGLGVGTGVVPPAGDVNISGQYQQSGSCLQGCAVATKSSRGRAVQTYASMVSQPTVEDFGEAQLTGGQTYVRLDARFANVIDQRTSYLVFITPEGDADTLYVAQKTIGGFYVRESHAGRSSIPFSYRIVAKPFGSHDARLPMVELPRKHGQTAGAWRRSRPSSYR